MTTLKRKLDTDSDDVSPTSTKQLKLIPFPNIELDTDVAMSEPEPLYPNTHHSRLQSSASSISSSVSDSPISGIPHPSFDLYSLPFCHNNGLMDPNSDNSVQSPNPPVGLLQPSSPFIHHGYAAKFFLEPTFYLINGAFIYLLLGNSGRIVHKSQNSRSPVPPVSMANARCGVTANNVAQFLWYSVIEIALLTVSSPTTKDKPAPNLDPTTSSTLAILFRLFSLCAIIAESFFLYHNSCQSFVSDSSGRHYQLFNYRNLQHMRQLRLALNDLPFLSSTKQINSTIQQSINNNNKKTGFSHSSGCVLLVSVTRE